MEISNLTPGLSSLAKWSLIGGNYFIWDGHHDCGDNRCQQGLPMAGAGFSASRSRETLVTILEVIGVILSLISGGLILWGLARTVLA